jgi:hypothetical protein
MREYAKVEAISSRSAQRIVRRITLLGGLLVLASAFSIFVACSAPAGPKQANTAPQAAPADWKAVETELDRPDPEIDRIWAEEARNRWAAYKAGRIPTVSYEDLMAKYDGRR